MSDNKYGRRHTDHDHSTGYIASLLAHVLIAINQSKEAIMASISDLEAKIADLEAESSAQTAQIEETIVTLGELKALISAGTIVPDELIARLDAIKANLSGERGKLDIAEEAADPTPDAPPTP